MKVAVIIPIYNVENYLEVALRSVQKQTFMDFDVIMVNDGSTDHSFEIMRRFSEEDERFRSFTKENGGVSEARNYGLEQVSEDVEYILFVDADDRLPSKAIEELYRCAKRKNADMVIGGVKTFGIEGNPIYYVTKELADTEVIDRYDPRMLYTFGLWNKLLSMSVIRTYQLRFDHIRHAEDGLFLFSFLYHVNSIAGCKSITYQYRTRPFWDESSAMQTLDKTHLTDLIYAGNRIVQMAQEQKALRVEEAVQAGNHGFLQVEQTLCRMEEYVSELHSRLVEVSLLGEYYRQIWKKDDAVVELLRQTIEKEKQFLFPDMWQAIMERNPDLRLERGLLTKKQLLEDPLITVAISDRIPEGYILRVLQSLFYQKLPAIIIYMHEKWKSHLPEKLKRAECIVFCGGNQDTAEFKNTILKQAKSPYIHFIDEPVYLRKDTYRNLYKIMEEKPYVEFASSELRLLNGTDVTEHCRAHDILFFEEYLPAQTKTIWHSVDWMSGNKLFRTFSLRNKRIVFTNDPQKDVMLCYKKLCNKSVNHTKMLTPLTEREIVASTRDWRVRFFWKKRYNREPQQWTERRHRLKKAVQQKIWAVKRGIIRLLPIRKKVLFVSIRGDKLLENAKAVYEAYDGEKRVFAHMYPHSDKQKLWLYWHMFTSKVIVTDDYFKYFRDFKLKPEQKIIQIWHASGAFKKFGLDNIEADMERERKTHAQYNVVVVSAESIRTTYAKAFGIPAERVQALGVPRTDKLLDESYLDKQQELFYQKYPNMAGKKIILYAMTFREKGRSRITYRPGLDWNKVSQWLGPDRVMIVKNHPLMKYDLLENKKFENIINMPKEDTSRLMIVCDVLLTDYSSVIFETALLKKPAVFYCPDFDTYERDFYLNFPEDLYGELTKNQEEMQEALDRALTEPDLLKLEQFKENYMGSCDGHSTERVVELIKQKLEET